MRINWNNGNKSLQGLKTRTIRTRPQGPGQGRRPDPQGQGQRPDPQGPGLGQGLEICP